MKTFSCVNHLDCHCLLALHFSVFVIVIESNSHSDPVTVQCVWVCVKVRAAVRLNLAAPSLCFITRPAPVCFNKLYHLLSAVSFRRLHEILIHLMNSHMEKIFKIIKYYRWNKILTCHGCLLCERLSCKSNKIQRLVQIKSWKSCLKSVTHSFSFELSLTDHKVRNNF